MKAMSWEKLDARLSLGDGQGHLEGYRAFLQVTRSNIARQGNQAVGPLPNYRRRFNFLSRVERHVALACTWLGALDVREQFPLWPWPHAHPLSDWPHATVSANPAPGLLDIAREAQIDHGHWVGSRVPYVATLDLMLTVGTLEAPRLAGIACKPKELLTLGEKSERRLARLELERRYCQAVGATHVIVDRGNVPQTLAANLEALAPDAGLLARTGAHGSYERLCDLLTTRLLAGESIRAAVFAAVAGASCFDRDGWDAFRLLAWTQAVDIDLSRPIHHTQPVTPGGRALRATMRRQLFGDA